jgi:23S rRNA-/tRNA-specific pseudouridylate synthase
MFAYGHPLLGDPLYFTKKTKVRNQKAELKRLFLVSKELGFKDLDGEKQLYTIDLPVELDNFIKKLK